MTMRDALLALSPGLTLAACSDGGQDAVAAPATGSDALGDAAEQAAHAAEEAAQGASDAAQEATPTQ